jgi:hypothetical protein
MDALLFLLVTFGLIAVGTTVVLVRAREPKGEYRGIKSFQREMQALAPATPPEGMERPAGVDPLLYERLRAAAATDGGDVAAGTSDLSGPRPVEHQE